jgi:phosphate transport system permease protein
MVPAVVLYLGWEALALVGSGHDLTGLQWYPTDGLFGLAPLVGGTLATSLLAMLIAVPIGLGAAIALHFYAPPSWRRTSDAALGVLGGTPSVVFGLFVTVWAVPRLGANLASAVLVLTAMVTPTFTLLALATLRQLPTDLMESGTTLGLTRGQVIRTLALRVARPQLAAAATFSLARCLGEALAVEMVCGNVANMPTALSQPVRTLTTTLVQEFDYALGDHRAALHLVALTVVLLAALTSTLAIRFARGARPT